MTCQWKTLLEFQCFKYFLEFGSGSPDFVVELAFNETIEARVVRVRGIRQPIRLQKLGDRALAGLLTMGDWDDEETTDVVAQKIASCWDDDLGEAVPESWDAEEPKPKPQPVAPAPEKLPLAERLRLKEEKRRKEKEEKLKREEELRAEQSMTELQREKLAEEAELGLLQDTFGAAPVVPDTKNSIDACEPRTKEDFNVLNDLLQAKLRKIEKSPHYSAFAEKLIRDAMTEVDVDALKSLSTAITALITEKQKLVKGKIKKKGKGKLLVEREDDYNFQEDNIEPDEYDDFM